MLAGRGKEALISRVTRNQPLLHNPFSPFLPFLNPSSLISSGLKMEQVGLEVSRGDTEAQYVRHLDRKSLPKAASFPQRQSQGFVAVISTTKSASLIIGFEF